MATESTLKRYTSAHAVFSLSYHIVFCPKYRRPVLSPLEEELKALFQEKAMEMGLTIKAMEIMPDHVHIFLTAPPSLEPQYIVNQLKGYTSRILRQEHKWLRSRLPTLWTRSYYIGSVGTVSASTVEKFIENQKGV
jgi:putative transposase